MYNRTVYRRRSPGFRRRRKHNWQWVRATENFGTAVIAPSFTFHDLLAPLRSSYGISLNFPDIVIWRLRIKLALRISVAPATAISSADGVLFTAFCDTINQTLLNPVLTTSAYAEQYMWYEQLMAAEPLYNGLSGAPSGNEIMLYRDLDIRVHRKLQNIDQTLWTTISPTNNVTIVEHSHSYSALLKLGR